MLKSDLLVLMVDGADLARRPSLKGVVYVEVVRPFFGLAVAIGKPTAYAVACDPDGVVMRVICRTLRGKGKSLRVKTGNR